MSNLKERVHNLSLRLPPGESSYVREYAAYLTVAGHPRPLYGDYGIPDQRVGELKALTLETIDCQG